MYVVRTVVGGFWVLTAVEEVIKSKYLLGCHPLLHNKLVTGEEMTQRGCGVTQRWGNFASWSLDTWNVRKRSKFLLSFLVPSSSLNHIIPSGRRDDRGRSPPAAYSYAQQGGGAYRWNSLWSRSESPHFNIVRIVAPELSPTSINSTHPITKGKTMP